MIELIEAATLLAIPLFFTVVLFAQSLREKRAEQDDHVRKFENHRMRTAMQRQSFPLGEIAWGAIAALGIWIAYNVLAPAFSS